MNMYSDYYYTYEDTLEVDLREIDILNNSIMNDMESVDFYIEPFHNNSRINDVILFCNNDIGIQCIYLGTTFLILLAQFGTWVMCRRNVMKYKRNGTNTTETEAIIHQTYV